MTSTNQLKERIASELNRPLTEAFGNSGETFNQVVNRCINQAMQHYESNPFRWNQVRRSEFATTAAGVRTVSLPANFVAMDTLRVIYSGSFLPITKIGVEEFDELDTRVSATSNAGIPSRYVIYGNTLHLHPAPGGAYTLVASYTRRFLPTSVTGSSTAVIPISGTYSLTVTTSASHHNRINGWTTDGAALFCARAKADIKINYLNDPAATQEMAVIASKGEDFLSVAEKQAYSSLADETFDALATGKIRKYGL